MLINYKHHTSTRTNSKRTINLIVIFFCDDIIKNLAQNIRAIDEGFYQINMVN